MSESDESGMGIVRRRRSRRLLETRNAATKDAESRITTESAAAAWGDILSGHGGLSEEIFEEVSTPPSTRAPELSPRIVELQEHDEPDDEFSRPVRGARTQSGPIVVEPDAAQPLTHVTSPSTPPKAQLRGVPLSNRPGAVTPPKVEARAARISEAPRKRSGNPLPSSAPSSEPVPEAAPEAPFFDETADFEKDTSLLREALRASQPNTALTSNTGSDSTLEFLVELEESVETQEIEPSATPAPAPRNRRRTFALAGVVLLFFGACVWSAAITFDEMERSARLNRVADALDGRVARIVEENVQLSEWIKARDAAMLQQLSDKELPIFRETLTATGYAAGVPKLKMQPETTSGRMIFEVTLPNAILALDSNGDWIQGPPRKGFGAALKANVVPIVVGFAIPTLAAITVLVATRRRRPVA